MLWTITGQGNEGSRNFLSHIKYITEYKDTDVSFYLEDVKRQVNSLPKTRAMKQLSAATWNTGVRLFTAARCSAAAVSVVPNLYNHTELYLAVKDRKQIIFNS